MLWLLTLPLLIGVLLLWALHKGKLKHTRLQAWWDEHLGLGTADSAAADPELQDAPQVWHGRQRSAPAAFGAWDDEPDSRPLASPPPAAVTAAPAPAPEMPVAELIELAQNVPSYLRKPARAAVPEPRLPVIGLDEVQLNLQHDVLRRQKMAASERRERRLQPHKKSGGLPLIDPNEVRASLQQLHSHRTPAPQPPKPTVVLQPTPVMRKPPLASKKADSEQTRQRNAEALFGAGSRFAGSSATPAPMSPALLDALKLATLEKSAPTVSPPPVAAPGAPAPQAASVADNAVDNVIDNTVEAGAAISPAVTDSAVFAAAWQRATAQAASLAAVDAVATDSASSEPLTATLAATTMPVSDAEPAPRRDSLVDHAVAFEPAPAFAVSAVAASSEPFAPTLGATLAAAAMPVSDAEPAPRRDSLVDHAVAFEPAPAFAVSAVAASSELPAATLAAAAMPVSEAEPPRRGSLVDHAAAFEPAPAFAVSVAAASSEPPTVTLAAAAMPVSDAEPAHGGFSQPAVVDAATFAAAWLRADADETSVAVATSPAVAVTPAPAPSVAVVAHPAPLDSSAVLAPWASPVPSLSVAAPGVAGGVAAATFAAPLSAAVSEANGADQASAASEPAAAMEVITAENAGEGGEPDLIWHFLDADTNANANANANTDTEPPLAPVTPSLVWSLIDEPAPLATAALAAADVPAVLAANLAPVAGVLPAGMAVPEPLIATAMASLAAVPIAKVHVPVVYGDACLPSLALLRPPETHKTVQSEDYLIDRGILIEEKCAEFKVKVSVVDAYAGPVITRYEVEPAVGVRGNQVVNLSKDLSRALGVASIRMVETIPGKTCMGLELPNPQRQMIRLSEIFSAEVFQQSASKLTLALGQDISGAPVVMDLAKAPHLLVAGTTGSGKSVGVNAMILSMLYKATPDEVRFIMIDPKMLELSVYNDIPHLLAPVVTDMKLAANALNWCVGEMEKRYRLLSHLGVRNLAGYNDKVRAAEAAGKRLSNPFSLTPETPEPLYPLPFIVVVVDEFADLMMVAGKKIEELIARLAQKARAAGIHLILATQRPSVDVITGLIKANIPTRIAFQVSSKIDSRTILDQMGAESLLGQGDMLFLPPGTGYPQRVHGAFVTDEEVHAIVEDLKQWGEPDYIEGLLTGESVADDEQADAKGRASAANEVDPLYDEAVEIVLRTRKASISSVQRQLRIGYNRAARLIEDMEAAGIVSAMENNGNRTVLVPQRDF